ncbi:MAG: Rrf2 family transcriptional regulator, partial [Planctomycetota bacterium]|nr:Rrf2 family transcriptional regulator [Planctomycetota bacterium]
HSELLETHRGIKGGFHLARPTSEITVAEMIISLEGPISMTECGGHEEGSCDMESLCVVKDKWKKINDAVVHALEGVTLADLTNSDWSPVTLRGELSEISGRK